MAIVASTASPSAPGLLRGVDQPTGEPQLLFADAGTAAIVVVTKANPRPCRQEEGPRMSLRKPPPGCENHSSAAAMSAIPIAITGEADASDELGGDTGRDEDHERERQV